MVVVYEGKSTILCWRLTGKPVGITTVKCNTQLFSPDYYARPPASRKYM